MSEIIFTIKKEKGAAVSQQVLDISASGVSTQEIETILVILKNIKEGLLLVNNS